MLNREKVSLEITGVIVYMRKIFVGHLCEQNSLKVGATLVETAYFYCPFHFQKRRVEIYVETVAAEKPR